jgi:hypothetical protein
MQFLLLCKVIVRRDSVSLLPLDRPWLSSGGVLLHSLLTDHTHSEHRTDQLLGFEAGWSREHTACLHEVSDSPQRFLREAECVKDLASVELVLVDDSHFDVQVFVARGALAVDKFDLADSDVVTALGYCVEFWDLGKVHWDFDG